MDRQGLDLREAIAAEAAGSLGAAIFFASRSSGLATTSASAYDLMLVCDRPGGFYRAMSKAGYLHRSPALLGLLDGLLPPTQTRLVHGAGLVKASVLSMAAFQRATSAARQDQLVAGRLCRDVHVVWVRSPESARLVEDAIGSARRVTPDWVTPDLPTRFTLSEYVRQLFRTSFRFEVRPETDGRADALFEVQAGRLQATEDGAFSLPGPPSRTLRRRLYLEWSRVRATARWPKHAVTFVAPTALTGVVNILTKTPRANPSTTFHVSDGMFGTQGGSRESSGSGNAFGSGVSFAKAINDRWSTRISVDYAQSDPYSRPTGRVPVIKDPRVSSACSGVAGTAACIGGAAYPIDSATGNPCTSFRMTVPSSPKSTSASIRT